VREFASSIVARPQNLHGGCAGLLQTHDLRALVVLAGHIACNCSDVMDQGQLWVVVLAAGDGTRLSSLTRALYGDDRPKQFAVLTGEQSLLQETVSRAAQLVPLDRVLVVVGVRHEALAREQLAGHPGVDIVVQPKNLDTGPGLLLPLARINARDPRARVVFLPSDHHISNPRPLFAAIAASTQDATADRIVLVGVLPDHPEIEYGWIVRGRQLVRRDGSKAFEVASFCEKPNEATARGLVARGALWNTFISVGPIQTYRALARQYLPRQASLLDDYARHLGTPDEHHALAAAYDAMPAANFSRDLLAHARDLAVTPVNAMGWCDWGSPSRVFRTLEGTPHHEALVTRIASARLAS